MMMSMPLLHADVVVVHAVAGSGMDRAGAGVEGAHVVAQQSDAPDVSWMTGQHT